MKKKENMQKYEKIDNGPVFGIRYIQFIFLFFVGFLVYSTRFGFSVALIAMTQNHSSNPDIPYYNWTNRSFILSTFFWGYVIPQIPIGILGTKFGSKKFLIAAIFMNSVCMILIPTVASVFGSTGVMAFRVIQGFSQGFVVPSAHGIIGKWAPPNEKSRVFGVMSTGYSLGTIVGLSTTGLICDSSKGWPLSFYLLPSTGFLWAILYYFYGAASPVTHSTISKGERNYIRSSLKSQDIYNVAIPYRAILTSTPFRAQIVMALCSGWGYCMFTTELPIYMDKVMQFNVKANGIISALPQTFNLISVNLVAFTADYLAKKDYMSIGKIRKLMSSLGSIGSAILLLIFISVPIDQKILCIVVLVAAFVFRSLNGAGYSINHLDLAPNFAAVLMGFVNTSGEIFSFITPIAVQYIVYDESKRSLWRIVFIIGVCLYIFSACFYLKFASGEIQPWNYVSVKPKNISNTQEKPDIEEQLLH